ncbi:MULTISPECIES: N-acetylmuramoyl-L-alanine amidase [Desulfosporosinus]|uniref:N-acetylmuramoyl-L-alanine amidase n=1 Tax=Desulfosporosinus lacus DSM 15449 TaxID=1121420 RepID=A0A1M5RX32_9FIRM|nr:MULTISPECIES: N-acetylmuramoyl-L-alanine amidase [Desulfosporosinus]MDA8221055.1 N-acetylmuramoyl-L-alanine amidase [Desulfitobacterium hafniense]SHH30750.1 N-acetylmuramoyl-L-alanine amidase [Desulfosporosinus lacus DSM 15449]
MAKLKWRLLGMLALGLGFLAGFQNPVYATPLALETSRIYGVRQIDTAISVSKYGWEQAETVLLANCDNFPDALVAAPLSHQLDAPILLTPSGGVDAKVMEEIKRLGAEKVILLGGTAALSQKVEQDIVEAGLDQPERIYGYDQYETAQKVAERVGAKGEVILASGEQFPDALSISAYAGAKEIPILLTKSKQMPGSTQQALDSLQDEGDLHTIVVGGEAVVSSATLGGLKSVERIFGNDRYETAAEIYEFARDTLSSQTAYLVTGENFPDALAAGGLAAKQRASIVMTQTTSLPGPTYSVLSRPAESPLQVVIIGGTAVITNKVKGMLEGTEQPSYLLAGLTIVVDPGHGGPDPGASGASGTYEKNNTLPVGLNLAALLRSAGAHVVLTRSTDVSPAEGAYSERADLEARTKIANDLNADLFVSLHNDSFSNPAASGTTTYYSSLNPVADQSLSLAQNIQGELIKSIGLTNRGVKNSPFYVVKNTKMPAVLIELGFLSNPTEENLLSSPEFQKTAAQGIYRGILSFKGY